MRVTMRDGKKHIPVRIRILMGFALVALVIFINVAKEVTDRRYEMSKARAPIIVEFPLRGEWLSPNTPGTKIPSHGTDQLGTRYAYDFIQVDW
ncbi:MAG: family metallopeptidase, partial [Firmicutes bacterium]|nr:family metallopeptidase [Bacillota bacterium]